MSSTARPRRVRMFGHKLKVDGPALLFEGWYLYVQTVSNGEGKRKYQAVASYIGGRGLDVRSPKCWSPRAAARKAEQQMHRLRMAIDDLVAH